MNDIKLTEAEKYDDVLLAAGTPFELLITRMNPQLLNSMESLLLPALIEELLILKRKVKNLEGTDGN